MKHRIIRINKMDRITPRHPVTPSPRHPVTPSPFPFRIPDFGEHYPMNRSFVVFLVALALTAFAGAAEAPAKDAYETVKTAPHFTIGGVGIAGIPSSQENAFRKLLKESGALERCQRLTTEATPAGQFYGLLGLRILDQKAFEAALPRYTDSKTEVPTMSGCIAMRTAAATLAGKIEKGEVK
jgi:hypothetical protein